jgi:hypothetical protein
MGRRRRLPTYRAWLRRRPSLDRPEAPISVLFAIEAVATVVVVGLILTAIVVVGLHRRAAPGQPAPPLAVGPALSLVPTGPAPGDSASATPGTTTPAPSAVPDTTPSARATRTAGPARAPAPSPKPTPAPTKAPYCVRATHVLNTQWPGGLQAQYTIANCGTVTVNGWVVRVGFSGPVSIQVWNAQSNGGSSTVDFSAVYYDTVIQPGASVTFGFNALWSGGPDRAITGCSIAGGTCR